MYVYVSVGSGDDLFIVCVGLSVGSRGALLFIVCVCFSGEWERSVHCVCMFQWGGLVHCVCRVGATVIHYVCMFQWEVGATVVHCVCKF